MTEMAGARAPRCVVITGASRGLGRALALAYAQRGLLLCLTARDVAALESVSSECQLRGADVEVRAANIAEPDALTDWLGEIERRAPIELLIANAGIFDGRRSGADGEGLDAAIGLLRVNLEGVVRAVHAVLPAMIKRRSGHIAVISSLAAVYPLADAPTYSASKAGVAAYGESLRDLVAPQGIDVTVVYPGHIATRQTDVHEGSLPLLMSAETAARRIRSGLDRRPARIWLPRRMALLARVGSLLPPRLRRLAGRSARFGVRDPGATG